MNLLFILAGSEVSIDYYITVRRALALQPITHARPIRAGVSDLSVCLYLKKSIIHRYEAEQSNVG